VRSEPNEWTGLSERYFVDVGAPITRKSFRSTGKGFAARACGGWFGMFCLTMIFPMDHDWGPAFCLWLNRQDAPLFGKGLQTELEKLPRRLAAPRLGRECVGRRPDRVFEIGTFYKQIYRSGSCASQSHGMARVIPESYLAAATNGAGSPIRSESHLFQRNGLNRFYPERHRLKKIAARCMTMAQSGHTTYMRSIRRGNMWPPCGQRPSSLGTPSPWHFCSIKAYKPF